MTQKIDWGSPRLVTKAAPLPNLEYALAYARLGWSVLPVWSVDSEGQCRCGRPNSEYGHNAGKHPHAKLAPRGHLDATTDEQTLRDMWAADPAAGIGIALSESGMLALDIDPRNGGNETLESIEAEYGVLHSDCVASTQGGGEHRLFKADAAAVFPAKLGAGLDLKHHGYICVAPTLGPTGEYRWAAGASPLSASHPAQPSVLPRLIAEKARIATDYSLTERGGAPVATAQTFDDLRSALKHCDADDYTAWVNVGMALHPYGEAGYRVWAEWSARSDKYSAEQGRRKWERDMDGAHSITYRSIFRMALDNGWPGSTTSAKPAAPVLPLAEHPLSLKRSVHSGAGQVTLFEYAFDDFMSIGVNVVAGAPGVGKTTLIVPLALAAAHLCSEDYRMRPAVRRNVVIVTESPVQVQRVIYSLCQWGMTGHTAADFEERVRVIPAQRLPPELVASVAGDYAGWLCDNECRDGSVFKARPLVLFDTANAVFDLESENDNSEVGRAMSAIKRSFAEFPVIIVAHTAKAQGNEDREAFSPRGAGAWTGDAQGVYTVFKDGDTEDAPRVLKAAKIRFPSPTPELTFDLVSNHERHPNVLGDPGEVWFAHSVARPLAIGERAALKAERKERAENSDWEHLCGEIIDLVRTQPGHGRTYYERMPVAQGGVKASQERKERGVTSLLNEGSLEMIESDYKDRNRKSILVVNEATWNEIESRRK